MYQTIYNNYTQRDLMSLFSTSSWNSLSYVQKIEACQEVENRYAAENNVESCLIMTKPMEGSCYGYYKDNTIYLNKSMVQNGVFTTTYKDENGNLQTRETGVLAPSWNTLDTVYHEGTHSLQESQGRMPYTYIDSDEDHDLYRIQGIEKEAYAVGQLRTLEAIIQVEKSTGQLDADRNEYIASVKADSFEEAVQQAALNYNDANIETTLASVIYNRELGIQPENPSKSYLAIQDLCDSYEVQRVSGQTIPESTETGYNNSNGTFQNASDRLEADFDDGFSSSQTTSTSYEIDYDDGYSATSTIDYSTDSKSVSDGMDTSTSEDMDNESDGGMDMY